MIHYMNDSLATFVKDMRKKFGLTQVDLAAKSGVGLRFVRELKQGKVYLYNRYAGLLTEDENGFTFVYDTAFLELFLMKKVFFAGLIENSYICPYI